MRSPPCAASDVKYLRAAWLSTRASGEMISIMRRKTEADSVCLSPDASLCIKRKPEKKLPEGAAGSDWSAGGASFEVWWSVSASCGEKKNHLSPLKGKAII